MGGVRVTGVEEARRDLNAVGDTLADPRQALADLGSETAAELRAGAPRRSGRLGSSVAIRQAEGTLEVSIGEGVVYAGPIIFGWPARNIAGNPFLRNTAERLSDRAHDAVREQLHQTIQERGLA